MEKDVETEIGPRQSQEYRLFVQHLTNNYWFCSFCVIDTIFTI